MAKSLLSLKPKGAQPVVPRSAQRAAPPMAPRPGGNLNPMAKAKVVAKGRAALKK
jgi:hypothetical protein